VSLYFKPHRLAASVHPFVLAPIARVQGPHNEHGTADPMSKTYSMAHNQHTGCYVHSQQSIFCSPVGSPNRKQRFSG
jgi:hypothetical protein